MAATELFGRVPLLRNAHAIIDAGPPRQYYLQHSGGTDALYGQDAQIVIEHILPRINGVLTADEIIAAVARTDLITASRAAQVIRWLVDAGLCVEDCEDPGDASLRQHFQAQIQYFSGYSSFPTICQKRLQASRVAVIGLEYMSPLLQQLAAAGVGYLRAVGNPQLLPAEAPWLHGAQLGNEGGALRHTLLRRQIEVDSFSTQYEGIAVRPGEPVDWPALLTDCHLAVLTLPRWIPSLVMAFNQACLSQNIPFLPVWFERSCAHVGPLVTPYETACLLCLELRRRSRWSPVDFRAIEQQSADTVGPGWEACSFAIPWVTTVAALAAYEVVAALAQARQPASCGHMLTLNALSWEMTPQPVVKVPRCPDCSRLRSLPSQQPFTLRYQQEQQP